MRLGLIARADNSGLGVQTLEYARHLDPTKVLVIDVGHMYNDTEHSNKRTFLDRYPGAQVFNGWEPTEDVFREFCDGLDVVLSAECFYGFQFPAIARSMGVRTVLVPNFEFFPYLADPTLPRPDLFAFPSSWRTNEVHYGNKMVLPVPISTDRFTPCATATPSNFLHIVGRPAHLDRNGTPDVLQALQHVTAEITVTLRCQHAGYVGGLIHDLGIRTPKNVTLIVDSSDVQDYWNNYQTGDVLLMPRRFGGLCLPVNEALGAGMPVVMTEIEPNTSWLPPEWLVPATRIDSFIAMNRVDVYRADHLALAAMIDRFATDRQFYENACIKAAGLRDELSWEAMLPKYREVLGG